MHVDTAPGQDRQPTKVSQITLTHRKRETIAVVTANNAFGSCKAYEYCVHRLNNELKLSLLSLTVYATAK